MFILSDQRRASDATRDAFGRYHEYLERNRDAFPPSALALATAEWYFRPDDHRCPHDARLEEATFTEPSTGDRRERITSLRLRLLGAYHDGHLEFTYPHVFQHSWAARDAAHGHGDWRYDEFRLSHGQGVLHEIEWSGGGRWVIEASDVELRWIPARPSK